MKTFLTTLVLSLSAASIAFGADETFEKDRAAILAMAGAYDVQFHFEETVALKPDYKKHDDDDTEAKELVIVVSDSGKRIELQHLLVDGEMVVKHWRQEWVYENTDLLEFAGKNSWKKRTLTPEEAKGTWTQRVTSVDDSPRYEGFGKWEHAGNWVAWESNETWRPLPRREYTTRSDYQTIIGRNRHALTPTGWVHEQDNGKVVLDAQGIPTEVLVLERALNAYNKCDAKDLQLAADYWKTSSEYWAEVRSAWDSVRKDHTVVAIKDKVEGKRLSEALNELGKKVEKKEVTITDARASAEKTIRTFVAPEAQASSK